MALEPPPPLRGLFLNTTSRILGIGDNNVILIDSTVLCVKGRVPVLQW
jgi:hypothetical protein